MKKSIAALLLLGVILNLCACGSSIHSQEETDSHSSTAVVEQLVANPDNPTGTAEKQAQQVLTEPACTEIEAEQTAKEQSAVTPTEQPNAHKTTEGKGETPTKPNIRETEPTEPTETKGRTTEATEPEPTETEPTETEPEATFDINAAMTYGNSYAESLGFHIDYSLTPANASYWSPDEQYSSVILKYGGQAFLNERVKQAVNNLYNWMNYQRTQDPENENYRVENDSVRVYIEDRGQSGEMGNVYWIYFLS